MYRLEFLLEESSMENVLKEILPKILPQNYRLNVNYFLHPHSGKSDLQKSIPNKMRMLNHFKHTDPVILIILHDQDSHDCIALKEKLQALCQKNGNIPFLIRIVCRELEAWYLGDMKAIETAYPKFRSEKFIQKKKFRDPDHCNAANELSKILPGFQKNLASKCIPMHLDIKRNTSKSFQQFVMGIQKVIGLSFEKIES